MPRWIVLIAVLAGAASFCAGAVVGAHTQATASPSRLIRTAGGARTIPMRMGRAGASRAGGAESYSQRLRRK
jgi:hypothetical protein